MTVDEAVAALRDAADPSRKTGMARVGISTRRALGVSVPNIRRIAKHAGTDHALALRLWASGIHEARILATLVADPHALNETEMEAWAADLDSWDVTDSAAELFAAAPLRDRAIRMWAARDEPYVKRAAFAMIARRAVRDHAAGDAAFIRYLPLIRQGADDDRNEVKKGVSWALRQIGKRDRALNAAAVGLAERILADAERTGSRGARWVARDVLSELQGKPVRSRLKG